MKGPWTPAGQLPASFSKLPADDNWKDVKAAVPGKKLDAKKVPTVFVSLVPAEMILLRGEPSYSLVEGTSSLLWVQNTDSDVFRVGRTGPIYYLVAGRWFSAADFTGPWTFATPTLPEEFKKIPVEHPRSRVLASVPGTSQAAEAVLLAQVPQTARVKKSELKAPEVAYQGEPKFEPIEKTTVARAVNTDKDIVKVGDLYYMCFQGVWFMAKAPQGPWEVATSVPEAIYQIPASSPVHNVTYVTVVEDNSNDDWVTFAAVAGYTGLMIGWGCAVWGTGYYYPPYWGMGGYYPYYYPHYPTYGYGAWYNPWTGGYGRTAVAYGPYGGAGIGARYNPRTGTYARGAAAWGPYGARGAAQAYNPRTGTYAQTRQGSNVYGSWGSRPCSAATTGHHVARHQQPHGQHDPRDAGQRRRRGHLAQRRRHGRPHGQRRRVRRPRRQRLPQGGRQLAEVRQRLVGQRRAACGPATGARPAIAPPPRARHHGRRSARRAPGRAAAPPSANSIAIARREPTARRAPGTPARTRGGGGSGSYGGSYRPSGGARAGGGMRGGGGRRR